MITKEDVDKVAVALVEKLTIAGIKLEKTGEHLTSISYRTPSGVLIEVTRDYSRRTREHIIVINVGGRGWGRRRSHGFSDREGKGYDWKAIIAKVMELSVQYAELRAQRVEHEATQARAEARLATLSEEFHLPVKPEHRTHFGTVKGIEIYDNGEERLGFTLRMDRLTMERMRDVMTRLASVGLLVSA